MNGNVVVAAVAVLVWGLVFGYLVRLERRIRDLEKR
jgi:CcmD family protein